MSCRITSQSEFEFPLITGPRKGGDVEGPCTIYGVHEDDLVVAMQRAILLSSACRYDLYGMCPDATAWARTFFAFHKQLKRVCAFIRATNEQCEKWSVINIDISQCDHSVHAYSHFLSGGDCVCDLFNPSSDLNGTHGEATDSDDVKGVRAPTMLQAAGAFDRQIGAQGGHDASEASRNRREASNRLHMKKKTSKIEGSVSDVRSHLEVADSVEHKSDAPDPAAVKTAQVLAAKEEKAKSDIESPESKLVKKYGTYAVDDILQAKIFLKAKNIRVTCLPAQRYLMIGLVVACFVMLLAELLVAGGLSRAVYLVLVGLTDLAAQIDKLVVKTFEHGQNVTVALLVFFQLVITCFLVKYVFRKRFKVGTQEWETMGAARIFRFSVLDYPEECNENEVNSMAHAGFNAYRKTGVSKEALNWLKFQKTNKPSSFTQQQYADLLLREFSAGRATHDQLFDTASFHHQLMIAKHYMFSVQSGDVQETIERM